jgi:hypothetical protein
MMVGFSSSSPCVMIFTCIIFHCNRNAMQKGITVDGHL